MNAFDLARLRDIVNELASALQVVTLTAEQLERSSAATTRDVKALVERLERVTAALHSLREDPKP